MQSDIRPAIGMRRRFDPAFRRALRGPDRHPVLERSFPLSFAEGLLIVQIANNRPDNILQAEGDIDRLFLDIVCR